MQTPLLPLAAAVALSTLTPTAPAAPMQDLLAVLVRDVNSRPAGPGTDPAWLTPLGDRLFFSAYTDIGYELWGTDGTTEGTTLVRDIAPLNSSTPSGLVALGDALLFSAYEGTERELWRSDGTEAGTVRVKDIDPGGAFTVAGDLAFFVADDGTHGRELWASDGTEAGTSIVADLAPGPDHGNVGLGVDVGGTLYFTRRVGGSSLDVWRSDGTAAGTVPVVEFGPTSNSNLAYLVASGGDLYFVAVIDGDRELWKHDPATGSTTEIEVNPTAGSYPNELTDVAGVLYFRANVDGDDELWRLDGETPVRVKDVNPTGSSVPQMLTAVGAELFFSADDGVTGRELWKTDGTEAGTSRVADLNPAGNGIWPQVFFDGIPLSAAVGETLFFIATDGDGTEVWRSDGTEAGTVELETAPDGTNFPHWLVDFNGTACWVGRRSLEEYSEDDLILAYELWTSDGTPQGTVAHDFAPGRTLPSAAVPQRVVGSTLYFIANDGEIELTDEGDIPADLELWKTDGTAAGTARVADINPSGSAFPPTSAFSFGELDGTVFFTADDGVTGRELWKSDGTDSGTVLVKDISASKNGGFPLDFTTVGGEVFFGADDGVAGRELWKTDGTEAGTVLVADIAPGAQTSFLQHLVEYGGELYFSADDDLVGSELWKSDGTTAGTVLVKDVQPGAADGRPSGFVVAGDTLFFRSNSRLWKSDGTGVGTVQVVGVSSVQELAPLDGALYFAASGDAAGIELWRHDPATDVTERVTDVHPSGNSIPKTLTAFDGSLFFVADDGTHGPGLWKYDPLTDTTESVVQAPVQDLKEVSGVLYFTAAAGGPIPKRNRSNLWRSDGTAAGTHVVDFGQGLSPTPTYLTDLAGRLVFNGYRYDVSYELFKLGGTPSLEITSPADGDVIEGAEVLVDGLATDDGVVVSVVVNEVEATLVPTGNPDDPAEVRFSALVPLTPGPNDVAAIATDDEGNTGMVTIAVEGGQGGPPPDCSNAEPSRAELWPPNHKMRTVRILGLSQGGGCHGVGVEITGVTSDEPPVGPGWKHDPDAVILHGGRVLLRAERFGGNNGRVYWIHFTATNEFGSCEGAVQVSVPHDQSGEPAIDDGQFYDATGGC